MNYRTYFILFVSPLTLTGCYIHTDITDLYPPPAHIEIDPGAVCACSGAVGYRFVNDTTAEFDSKYYEMSVVPPDTVPTRQEMGPVTLPVGDTGVFLGCSWQPDPPAADSCNTKVSYLPPWTIAYSTSANHVERSSDDRFVRDCAKSCQDGPSPFCLAAPEGSKFAKSFGSGLTRLHTKLMNPDTVNITSAEMLELFGQEEDECGREDTIIENGDVVNFTEIEKACAIRATLTFLNEDGEKEDSRVNLVLPVASSGEILRLDGRASLVHTNPRLAPILDFEIDGLNEDFGGRVARIDSWQDKVVLTTPAGCTSVPF